MTGRGESGQTLFVGWRDAGKPPRPTAAHFLGPLRAAGRAVKHYLSAGALKDPRGPQRPTFSGRYGPRGERSNIICRLARRCPFGRVAPAGASKSVCRSLSFRAAARLICFAGVSCALRPQAPTGRPYPSRGPPPRSSLLGGPPPLLVVPPPFGRARGRGRGQGRAVAGRGAF